MKKLVIIGAGLGADSITLQGINEMKKADVVLYDRLVHPEILKYAGETELVEVGKTPYSRHCILQSDINGLIEKYLAEDKTVVRLKGGDSTVFARSVEELETARTAGAQTVVVPGVTSAATLSAKMQTALTDRRSASGVMFITGHPKEGSLKDTYNWQAIATLDITIVIYMGVKNAGFITAELISCGMSPDKPVIIGEKLETPEERLFSCTLAALPDCVAGNSITNPATIVIGDVVQAV
jgi:uroporphyrin-III C-methyltransferase